MTTAETVFAAANYDLGATLDSGQAFRWRLENDRWHGVLGNHHVRLWQVGNAIHAQTPGPCADWRWLEEYLQPATDLEAVLNTFPDDPPMREAVRVCRGLRLLKQEPWECLASFILSSTKQIVQIRQIVALLCERFGEPLPILPYGAPEFSFPTAKRIAALTEAELRDCKMGFRAPYLLGTARLVTEGGIDLAGLRELPVESARAELMRLPGVGRKIADCVLLFGLGFNEAFPIDVWVLKALQQLYFPRRHATKKRLERFAATHFGPHAGYAQQYLFHYMRTKIE